MKEYKLSAKSKYSVLYLLCGLFMFFFMFAILSINGHCATGSLSCNPDGYTEQIIGYTRISYSTSWGSMVDPYTRLVSGDIKFVESSSAYFKNASMEAHFVTSCGDYVVLSTDSNNSTSSISSTYYRMLEGYPVAYYFVVRATTNGTAPNINSCYVTLTYNLPSNPSVYDNGGLSENIRSISSDTQQILSLLGGSSDVTIPSSFSDYSSYSPVSISATFETFNSFGLVKVPAGSLFSFYFDNYSGSTLSFADWINFSATGSSDFIYVVNFDCNTRLSNADFLELWVRGSSGGNLYTLTNPTFVYTGAGTGYFNYTAYFEFTLPDNDDFELYRVYMPDNSSGYTFSHPSYSLLSKKYTIDDYMKYTHDQWDNISPSVTDTNTNIAQSVSDIGTAQTFESSAFTNFDTQLSSSGLDTFSMSYASTPLLWVSGIITTFYNNMPSTFQYLLMFVAFVGILVIIFNISGRVIRRFGGGD